MHVHHTFWWIRQEPALNIPYLLLEDSEMVTVVEAASRAIRIFELFKTAIHIVQVPNEDIRRGARRSPFPSKVPGEHA